MEGKDMNKHLKKVVAHHDWWAETYDSDYFEHFAIYHMVTLNNIRRFVPKEKGATILDVGGGTGIWSIELAKMGYKVVLTDISEGMLAKAKIKVKEHGLEKQIKIMISDIRNMPEFSDNHFDMVLCQGDPLSYCGDHKRALSECVRILKPGGTLIASVDNRASALAWLKDSTDREAVKRLLETGEVEMPTGKEEFTYTIHAFTPEELRGLFESNGLQVERIIGKPVIAPRLSFFKSEDPEVQKWLYNLELKYNDDPAFYPRAGHLEIVGRKT
jgi:ubiquinone/menaquinone biosynthesis C-methylase UbiE